MVGALDADQQEVGALRRAHRETERKHRKQIKALKAKVAALEAVRSENESLRQSVEEMERRCHALCEKGQRQKLKLSKFGKMQANYDRVRSEHETATMEVEALKRSESKLNELLRARVEGTEYERLQRLYSSLQHRYDILLNDSELDADGLLAENKALRVRLRAKERTAAIHDILSSNDLERMDSGDGAGRRLSAVSDHKIKSRRKRKAKMERKAKSDAMSGGKSRRRQGSLARVPPPQSGLRCGA